MTCICMWGNINGVILQYVYKRFKRLNRQLGDMLYCACAENNIEFDGI